MNYRPASLSTRVLAQDLRCIPAQPLCQVIVDICCSRGVSEHKLLRGTGIFETDIRANASVSVQQLAALLVNAEKLSGARELGFLIAQALATSHFEGLIKALGYSRDLKQALRYMPAFLLQLCPLVSFGEYQQGGARLFTFRDATGSHKAFGIASMIICSAMVALSKQWCGHRLPVTFHFPFSRPRRLAEYEMYLGRRLHFDSPCFSMTITEADLTVPFAHADNYLFKASMKHFANSRQEGALLPQVVREMVTRNPQMSASDLAESLDISPATLKRKLKECNVTFTALNDEVRREQAVFLLRICRLTNEQSAQTMAISDLTNFRRAVKRWTGLTPSEVRGH